MANDADSLRLDLLLAQGVPENTEALAGYVDRNFRVHDWDPTVVARFLMCANHYLTGHKDLASVCEAAWAEIACAYVRGNREFTWLQRPSASWSRSEGRTLRMRLRFFTWPTEVHGDVAQSYADMKKRLEHEARARRDDAVCVG